MDCRIDHAPKARQGKMTCVMFHTCIKLFPLTYVYVCIYYISGGKWSTTHSAQISQKQNRCDIYIIMKTKCTPSYYYNGFVANHALGHIINTVATVHHVPRCMICHMAIVVTETGGHIVSMNVYIYVNIYVNI